MPNARVSREHLYLSCNFWDSLWIIQQPICNEIQKDERVLYVERFVSVFTVLRYPRLWRRLFTWLRGARSLSPNLRVLAPLPLFHLGHRFPRIFRLEFAIQRRWILWWAGRRGTRTRLLWLDNPLYECAVSRLGEDAVIYHVGDEVSAFPASHVRISQALERSTLRKASLVFAAAEQLAADKRSWQPRTYTVWNAIDTRAFDVELPRDRLQAIDRIPKPRVAFVGVLERWVDLTLLELVATKLRHVQFLLIGPTQVEDRALRVLPNVHFLGRRDRLEVPSILRRCSASLVPFTKSKLTERVVPLKVFEALAAGIMPVCTDFSSDLDALERDRFAAIGRSPDAFVAAVERAIAEDSTASRERLSNFGLRQTWKERWIQMNGVITAYLATSRRDSPAPVAKKS
jgi:glycosyltransferase involved in cell wall biosynthesis